ncbi:MAG: hypothetical protein E3J52_10940 [Promethearchaeota archaeon]|nr:MAG: hypothetical protein E3J52_10940 [Candidatus Lokiarchaeota archaeon]
MIAMNNAAQNSNNASEKLHMLGYGLLNISELDSGGKLNVLFQNGIGVSLIQNIFELYKNEIINKRQGNSIIPLDDFTIHIQYFKNGEKKISVIIYMEEKEPTVPVNFPKLYFLSKKINKKILSNAPISEITKIFESEIEIPKTDGVIAIFIIGSTGSPFISKINKKRSNIADHEVHIGGFISALLSFSNTIIGEETGAKLKEINFGNQQFYVISKSNVIFAFLVENMNQLLQRYMYLIADEFLFDFRNYIKEFNGDVTPFNEFESKINQYFII